MNTIMINRQRLVRLFAAFLISHCSFLISSAQIGAWRNHLAYYDVKQIQKAGNMLYVMASGSLYTYNLTDHSIVTYDRTNGMSDTGISSIKWCQSAKRLIIVYSNLNIDLMDTSGDVVNISDLKTSAIMGRKTLNSINICNQYAYLGCGFGIVKIDAKRAEVSETYMLNASVTGVAVSGETIYARIYSAGIKFLKASTAANLIDRSNWTQTTENVAALFTEDNSDYNNYKDEVATLTPGGPKYNYFYHMRFSNGSLYTCGGQYEPLSELERPGTIQVMKDNEWNIYEDNLETVTGHQYLDIDCLDIDPNDETHVFAGGRTGLYEFKDGRFVREYNYDNSELTSTFDTDPDYVIVNTVKFDTNGNLWMIQSLNRNNKLMVLNSNGTWTKKSLDLFNLNDAELGNILGNARNIIFDSKGYLWFGHDHHDTPALFRYDPTTDKDWKYTNFTNQDDTRVYVDAGVRCALEDKEGNIWIATNVGPLYLKPDQVESSNPIFTQFKVPRNDGTNYADYLLSGIDISCMAIDGGNRKWFGTKGNGVYLISADNMTQIQHFTTDNSPLLSNNVQSIAINPSSGEVFFGTENGLCSYVSDATQTNEEMTSDNVWAYPNPVNPDYTGPITITGLSYNADVKILSANGALIHEGRSNGGSYVWYGTDQKGRRVASGVYMVVTATSTGEKGTVCKIAIVR